MMLGTPSSSSLSQPGHPLSLRQAISQLGVARSEPSCAALRRQLDFSAGLGFVSGGVMAAGCLVPALPALPALSPALPWRGGTAQLVTVLTGGLGVAAAALWGGHRAAALAHRRDSERTPDESDRLALLEVVRVLLTDADVLGRSRRRAYARLHEGIGALAELAQMSPPEAAARAREVCSIGALTGLSATLAGALAGLLVGHVLAAGRQAPTAAPLPVALAVGSGLTTAAATGVWGLCRLLGGGDAVWRDLLRLAAQPRWAEQPSLRLDVDHTLLMLARPPPAPPPARQAPGSPQRGPDSAAGPPMPSAA